VPQCTFFCNKHNVNLSNRLQHSEQCLLHMLHKQFLVLACVTGAIVTNMPCLATSNHYCSNDSDMVFLRAIMSKAAAANRKDSALGVILVRFYSWSGAPPLQFIGKTFGNTFSQSNPVISPLYVAHRIRG
jgi:hypothetical protein